MNDTNKIIIAIVIIIAILGGIYLLSNTGPLNNNTFTTPTPSITSTVSPTVTVTVTVTVTTTTTATPTLTPTLTATPTISPTPFVSPSITFSPTATQSPVTFNISATEFKFNPDSVTAKTGQSVTIVFSNNGNQSHDLVIEGTNIATKIIQGGQKDTIQFTAPAKGTYTFFCSVDGHRNLGLEGKLTIQ